MFDPQLRISFNETLVPVGRVLPIVVPPVGEQVDVGVILSLGGGDQMLRVSGPSQ